MVILAARRGAAIQTCTSSGAAAFPRRVDLNLSVLLTLSAINHPTNNTCCVSGSPNQGLGPIVPLPDGPIIFEIVEAEAILRPLLLLKLLLLPVDAAS